jgi:hypothetical protein
MHVYRREKGNKYACVYENLEKLPKKKFQRAFAVAVAHYLGALL